MNDFVIEDLQGLTETIKSTLRVAEKDNDLVYLKPVPKENDLAPIPGAYSSETHFTTSNRVIRRQ